VDVVQCDFGENLKATDLKRFQGMSGYQIRDENGIHRTNYTPRNAFDEASRMRRAYTVNSPKRNDIPESFVQIEEKYFRKNFRQPYFNGVVQLTRHDKCHYHRIDCSGNPPGYPLYHTSCMRISHVQRLIRKETTTI
jgi:hypothetical protein